MDNVLHYVELIGKIVATGISLYAIIWSLVTVVMKLKEKMEVAIENKDWESMINIINEFVVGVEQAHLGEHGVGEQKKAEVIELLKQSGYEITKVIEALIEASVYQEFNWKKEVKNN